VLEASGDGVAGVVTPSLKPSTRPLFTVTSPKPLDGDGNCLEYDPAPRVTTRQAAAGTASSGASRPRDSSGP